MYFTILIKYRDMLISINKNLIKVVVGIGYGGKSTMPLILDTI